jgi:mRNA interferase MazF
MKRGEIYVATLQPRSGSEQQGKRPVIIVSHDGFNSVPSWRSIIIVPLSTSKIQAARGPTAVHLPKGSGGLNNEGVALCHQITTLDRSKLTKRIGMLDPEALKQVEDGIKAALSL